MKLFGHSKRAGRVEKKSRPKLKRWQIAAIAGGGVLVLGVAAFFVVRGFIQPPPPMGVDEVIGGDDMAHRPGEYNPDDAGINMDKYAPDGVTQDDRNEQKLTFLVVGIDDGNNTDTIMVMSYDSATREVNVIGIPRDTRVNVKRANKKINAAYASGRLNGGGTEGGISQLQREIKTIIGFVPDYYALINMTAAVELIDLVGGVVVDVPFKMEYDDTTPGQTLHINIKKGDGQLLSGEDAYKFARYRRGNDQRYTISDYKRIEHQQMVIKAFAKEAMKPANWYKIPQMIGVVSDNVHTNLSLGQLAWVGEELKKANDTDSMHFHTMPDKGSSGSPNWFEFLDRDGVIKLVNETVNPYGVEITAADVDIVDNIP